MNNSYSPSEADGRNMLILNSLLVVYAGIQGGKTNV
jgi:hypothetical protein